jgi:uncharacterized membrane protein YhaH (DUF805 family)
MNVIDSNILERDASGKPLHTFPHPALGVSFGVNLSAQFEVIYWECIEVHGLRCRGVLERDFKTSMRPILTWYFLSLEGRISRREFPLGFIGLVLVDMFAVRIGIRLLDTGPVYYYGSSPPFDRLAFYVRLAVFFISLWPLTALLVKRLHDLNISGRWALAYFGVAPAAHALGIPYWLPSLFIVVALSAIPGSSGNNRFGSAPPTRT